MTVKKHRLWGGTRLVAIACLSVIGGSFLSPARVTLLAQGPVAQTPSPRLRADPNPVPHGPGKGTTTIEWDVGDHSSGRIEVSENGGPPALFASGPRGSATADWITSGSTYEFRLFGDDPAAPLASVRVTRAEPADKLVLIVFWMIVLGLGGVIALRAGLRARTVLVSGPMGRLARLPLLAKLADGTVSVTSRLVPLLGRRRLFVLIITAAMTSVISSREDLLVSEYATWLFGGYAVLGILLFAPRYWLSLGAVLVVFERLANLVNETKISLTQMPLTVLDFRILLHDPEGLLDVLKVQHSVRWLAAAGVVALAVMVIWQVWRRVRFAEEDRSLNLASVGGTLLVAALFLVLLLPFFTRSQMAIHGVATESGATWSQTELAALSRRLGIVPFLIYSVGLEKRLTGDFFDRSISAAEPSPEEIAAASKAFVRLRTTPGDRRPNIVVVFAESTFDVNRAFKLTSPVPNRLFAANRYTAVTGPLLVNAVGGGSWLSEFESLVGVDSRLFGYSGYYTHSSLAPFVKRTFVHYLRERGYSTAAYYSVKGDFYNARYAYAQYGFQHFWDARDLGLKMHWEATDPEVANAVVAQSSTAVPEPYYKYVVLSGNHSPHRCVTSLSAPEFVTTFSRSASFESNCILNEYIRLARATEESVDTLLKSLVEAEARSGRPFVLLVFGDHQPHTFTRAPGATDDVYAAYRTELTERHTFLHLMASEPGIVTCCRGAVPHVTLLPSLLSAYTASHPGDLYLGVNFFNYQQCGSDLMGPAAGPFEVSGAWMRVSSPRCAVYDRLVSAYRAAGIF